MRKQVRYNRLFIGVIVLTILLLGSMGCKKKLPKEEAPPTSPKVEEVKQITEQDTTGQAAQEQQRQMEADKSRIQNIYFDYDQSVVRVDQQTRVNGNAEIIRKWPVWQITVEGHCDERGTTEYNMALGERRALSIKRGLTGSGVEASRIVTTSLGEERPADSGHNEAAWSKNRRVEFKVK